MAACGERAGRSTACLAPRRSAAKSAACVACPCVRMVSRQSATGVGRECANRGSGSPAKAPDSAGKPCKGSCRRPERPTAAAAAAVTAARRHGLLRSACLRRRRGWPPPAAMACCCQQRLITDHSATTALGSRSHVRTHPGSRAAASAVELGFLAQRGGAGVHRAALRASGMEHDHRARAGPRVCRPPRGLHRPRDHPLAAGRPGLHGPRRLAQG